MEKYVIKDWNSIDEKIPLLPPKPDRLANVICHRIVGPTGARQEIELTLRYEPEMDKVVLRAYYSGKTALAKIEKNSFENMMQSAYQHYNTLSEEANFAQLIRDLRSELCKDLILSGLPILSVQEWYTFGTGTGIIKNEGKVVAKADGLQIFADTSKIEVRLGRISGYNFLGTVSLQYDIPDINLRIIISNIKLQEKDGYYGVANHPMALTMIPIAKHVTITEWPKDIEKPIETFASINSANQPVEFRLGQVLEDKEFIEFMSSTDDRPKFDISFKQEIENRLGMIGG